MITNSVYYLRQRLQGADEKLTRHAEILEREVAHAVRIIDNLVQFSRESAPYAYPVALRPVFEASRLFPCSSTGRPACRTGCSSSTTIRRRFHGKT